MFRGLSWTYARETAGNIRFGPVYLHDGQTFLVRGDSGIEIALPGQREAKRALSLAGGSHGPDTLSDFQGSACPLSGARGIAKMKGQSSQLLIELRVLWSVG